MSISTEIQSLSPSALVELFQLDLDKQGGPIIYFHNGVNELGNDVVFQGTTYSRIPILGEGFDKSSQGAIPRPRVRISNIEGVMAATAREYGWFAGCKLIRKRTFARFLDAVNFPGGTNPEADPNQEMMEEVWFVDRKAEENGSFIEFELASSMDMEGVKVPRRQIIQNTCPWIYRGGECGYAGPPVQKEDGTPTSNPAEDRCGKRLSNCEARFVPLGMPLPYGGFPGAGLIR